MMEDSHLEMAYEDRFVSDMDNDDGEVIETEKSPMTIYAIAVANGAAVVNGTINGGEFMRLGLPFFGGCEYCSASIAAYNAYPSKSGYLRCADCIEDDGYTTVEEFNGDN